VDQVECGEREDGSRLMTGVVRENTAVRACVSVSVPEDAVADQRVAPGTGDALEVAVRSTAVESDITSQQEGISEGSIRLRLT
jgi:hypothetical protein